MNPVANYNAGSTPLEVTSVMAVHVTVVVEAGRQLPTHHKWCTVRTRLCLKCFGFFFQAKDTERIDLGDSHNPKWVTIFVHFDCYYAHRFLILIPWNPGVKPSTYWFIHVMKKMSWWARELLVCPNECERTSICKLLHYFIGYRLSFLSETSLSVNWRRPISRGLA